MRRRWFKAAACGLALVACRPEFDERDWQIDSVRVLAVKSEPAEAKPGETVQFTAFLSADSAEVRALDWRFCVAPKPPTEDNVVSSACLGSGALTEAFVGLTIDASTPQSGCSLFGPDTPPGNFRPRDPDGTGGYYQPLRVDLAGAAPTFHLQRITCALANASADTANAFANAYELNNNPSLATLVARRSGQLVSLTQIPRGAPLDLELSWPAESAETYAYYDRVAQAVTTRRESLRVAWYVDGGKLETESTGRAEDDLALTTDNRWSAPDAPGVVQLWVVLRDSRAGIDFARYELLVSP